MTDFLWLERPDELAAACERWQGAAAVALDTEFVFERTFRPRLGLVQVAVPGEIALVDAVRLPDLAPLRPLLEDEGATKVVHAGSGDVGVLRRATGAAPRPLFDTQIAAAFAGLGAGLSYAALVETLTGVTLGKHETRTDWTRRPLSPAQLRYAAEDVEHLLGVAAQLERRLAGLGRLEWAREDSRELAADDDESGAEAALRRLRGLDRLSGRTRRIAAELALWREREAERLDLARPFLLRDETLIALARRPAATAAELPKLPGYEARRHADHAERWLAAVAAAREAADRPDTDLLARSPRPQVPLERLKRVGHALAEAVAKRAAALDLAPELLLSRRQRDRLLRAWDGTAPLSAGLAGWRRGLLAGEIDAAAR